MQEKNRNYREALGMNYHAVENFEKKKNCCRKLEEKRTGFDSLYFRSV
jgi:hypothetical protein